MRPKQSTILLLRQLLYFVLGLLIIYGIIVNSLPVSPTFTGKASVLLSSHGVKAPDQRILFLIVDGLSYDLLTEKKPSSNKDMNGLFPVLIRTKETEPTNTFFQKCITGAPTFTINGIKTILTGSAPDFAVLAFMQPKGNYETWLDQLSAKKKNYLIGNELWEKYAEDRNLKCEYIDSNKIVGFADDIIDRKMKKIMSDDNWDNILLHFTTFDSSVHGFKLHEPRTRKALKHTNNIIEAILQKVDNRTTVIVTSDHGMIENGHGGFSDEERKSFLFVYNKNGLLGDSQMIPKRDYIKNPITTYDIANVMSYYLGYSPPMNSIGNFPPQVQISNLLPAENSQIKNILKYKQLEYEQQRKLMAKVGIDESTHSKDLHSEIKRLFLEIDKNEISYNVSVSLFNALDKSNEEMRQQYSLASGKFQVQSYLLYYGMIVLHIISIMIVMMTENIQNCSVFDPKITAISMGVMAIPGVILAKEKFPGLLTGLYIGLVIANLYELGGGSFRISKCCRALILFIKENELFLPATVGLAIVCASSYWNSMYSDFPFQKHVIFFWVTSIFAKGAWVSLYKEFGVILYLGFLDYVRFSQKSKYMESWMLWVTRPNNWVLNLIPGIILLGWLRYILIKKYDLEKREFRLSIVIFYINYVLSWIYFFCMYHRIGGYHLVAFYPWINLILTVIGLSLMFCKEKPTELNKWISMLILQITPILMIMGRFNPYGITLSLFYVINNTWRTPSHYSQFERSYIANAFMILSFYVAGSSFFQSDLCLNCGALFMDTFHFFSGPILILKGIYPILLGTLFLFLMELKQPAKSLGAMLKFPMIMMITPYFGILGLFFIDTNNFTEYRHLGDSMPVSFAWSFGFGLSSLAVGAINAFWDMKSEVELPKPIS